MNVMFMKKSVEEIMGVVRKKCVEAFREAIADVQRSFDSYVKAGGGEPRTLPWRENVKLYSELYAEAMRDSGGELERTLAEFMRDIGLKIASGEMSLAEASRAVIEHTLLHLKDASPMVVIALVPPYYPVVGNSMLGCGAEKANRTCDEVIARAKSEHGDDYIKYYLVGMSDLSYFMQNPAAGDESYVKNNMLLWGDVYGIPFDELREISMPVLNIGPWGKDIHEYTERVFREDLLHRTPDLTAFAVEKILS
jgi:arginine utilization protein RocB